VKRLFGRKSVRIDGALFGHGPTGRGTIFIFRSKFLSIEGGARRAGQRMNKFLPGKTS
jgi:hypothetical protein